MNKTPTLTAGQSENTVVCCLGFLVPDGLAHSLEKLYQPSLDAARKMLNRRNESSSKFYPTIPCVISKSLIAKYQRNKKCRQIHRLVLPICGDKGRQIKSVEGGIRIPSIFKKTVIPITFRRPIVGHIRQVEFFRRNGKWLGMLCYNTPTSSPLAITGCIGVDRNSVGNVAVMADPQTGHVRHLDRKSGV